MMNRATRCVLGALCWISVCTSAAAAQEHVLLRGRVVEAGAGTAIAGAEVRASGYGASVVTGADGTWQMRVPVDVREITVEHLAFAVQTTGIDASSAELLTVRLTPRPVALGELVVTASRRVQELKDVPVTTEVIGREEIERSGAADLSAVLVERTGVGAEGGHPVGSGVMLQGLGAERVLVLIDGQPFIGRMSGSLDLSRIATSMIERVEVVKGPQSTLYGSDAMGGVVNVITRSPAGGRRDATLSLTGGSYGRLDAAANARGSLGDLAYSLDAGRRSVELVPGHAGSAGTFATRWDGNARVEWEASPALTFHAGALLLDESQRWKSGVLYNFVDNVQWGGRAGTAFNAGVHRLSSVLYATEFRHLPRRSTLPEPVAGGSEETEVQRLLEAEVLYSRAGDRMTLDAGIEARRESIHSARVTGRDRMLHAIEPFMQATLTGDNWSVVPGARVSWSEQWGAHVTPRLATMFRPAERLALRASLGRGFRAPSFKELYMEFLNTGAGSGYRVRGNPDLRPETSTNVSGSAEWSGERLYSRVQLFYNRFDDFIETRELPDNGDVTLFGYGNIDDGATYGAELELGATWRGLRMEAGYGWLEALDRATERPLLGRARHSARGSLIQALPFGMRASVSAVHTGATPVAFADDAAIVERAAFTRIDLRASQSLPYGFDLGAGIDNVLDATPAGYPGFLGRQFHIGLTWSGSGRP